MTVLVANKLSLVQELLHKQKTSMDYFFTHVDAMAFEKLIRLCRATSGTLHFTGVGKSGFLAQKIAMTMVSTGTKAQYISCQDALHGDLGFIQKGDLVFLFSKSGQTEELLSLTPFLRAKGAKTVAVVCKKDSRLEKVSDLSVYLPLDQELCSFDLSPTTSACLQLLFGDVLAMALKELSGFTMEDYGKNHPSGRIGQRINAKVRDLMIQGEGLPTCSMDDTLETCLVELSNKRCGCIIAVDAEHRALGMFTDGDLRRSLQKYGSNVFQKTMATLVTKKFRHISPHAKVTEAVEMMEGDFKHCVTSLLVLDNNRLCGLIRMHDIIQAGII